MNKTTIQKYFTDYKFYDFCWQQTEDEAEGIVRDYVYVDFEGVGISNPYMADNGQYELKDPIDYYGISVLSEFIEKYKKTLYDEDKLVNEIVERLIDVLVLTYGISRECNSFALREMFVGHYGHDAKLEAIIKNSVDWEESIGQSYHHKLSGH